MPRHRRHTHLINRGVGRQAIFSKDEDYAALEGVVAEACCGSCV
jgi:hypothetical protein